jgi:hypothetical protein
MWRSDSEAKEWERELILSKHFEDWVSFSMGLTKVLVPKPASSNAYYYASVSGLLPRLTLLLLLLFSSFFYNMNPDISISKFYDV